MYRIIDTRSSGKTSRLMLLAKETGAKIACANPNAMRQKAYAYGITGIDFIPTVCRRIIRPGYAYKGRD